MTFWPIREGPGAEPELDAIIHEIIRKHPKGLHLGDVARKVREVYPQNGACTLLTGVVELEAIVSSLCRLGIRGYVYRIGTERQPFYSHGSVANMAPPMGLGGLQHFENWPRWKPVGLLEVLAKAAGGDEPFRTKWPPYKTPRFQRFMRWLFRPSDDDPWPPFGIKR